MKVLVTLLGMLLLVLQYPLWIGDGSVLEVWQLTEALETQQQENARLQSRNQVLEAEVSDLKAGLEAIEERARSELGMIREKETFFHVIDTDSADEER